MKLKLASFNLLKQKWEWAFSISKLPVQSCLKNKVKKMDSINSHPISYQQHILKHDCSILINYLVNFVLSFFCALNNWKKTQKFSTIRQSKVNWLMPSAYLVFAFANFVSATLLDTSVSCDQANFVLTLNFDLPFKGIVYSEEGFPNCVYVNGTMLSKTFYQLKIPIMGCETHTNIEGNFENAIIIQENPAFLHSIDKKYLLTCIPISQPPTRAFAFDDETSNRENLITVDFGGVTVENTHTTTEIIRGVMLPDETKTNDKTLTSSLKYAVEIRNGHTLDALPLSAALNIGDKISYMVRLKKPVAESRIGRCWASDSTSNLELSNEHGCSLQPRGNIWGEFERVDTAKEVVFVNRIKAWAFPTSNEVNIFCNLRICMSHVCSFTNCTNNIEDGLSFDPVLSITLPTTTNTKSIFRNRVRRDKINGFSMVTAAQSFNPKFRLDSMFDSDFTEIETLRTHLRFRRQSIQQMRDSSFTKLVTVKENENENLLRLTTTEENNEGEDYQEEILFNNFSFPTTSNKKVWLIVASITFAALSLLLILLFVVWRKREVILEKVCKFQK